MSTSYKVRRLSTVGPGVVDRTYRGRGAAGAFMAMSDQAGAVYDIASNESELFADDIEARLKNGDLKPTDLVLVDGTWTTFADSIPFGDVVHGEQQANRKMGLIIGAVLAVLALMYIVATLRAP
jgi:hypothetical protein